MIENIINLVATEPILGVLIFSIGSIFIPVSILTIFIATLYSLSTGLAVIAIAYFLSIVIIQKLFSKILEKYIQIENYRIQEFAKKNLSYISIVIGALSIPFVPLVLILKSLKVESQKILIGVYLGGMPMMSLVYIMSNTGKEFIDTDTIRYISLLIVFFYILYKGIKLNIRKTSEK